MNRHIKSIIYTFALVYLGFFHLKLLQANLEIFPTKITLTDKSRSSRIALQNSSNESKSYRIASVFYRMDNLGRLKEVADIPHPTERSARDLIRFSPKRVTLKPGQQQVVRVLLRKKAQITEGEYRTHLLFREISKTNAKSASPSTGFSLDLKPLLSIAIPVFYRKGTPKVSVNLADLNFETTPEGTEKFSITMSYQGNAFPHGELKAFYIPPSGAPQEVFFATGVSSYIPSRRIRYELKERVSNKVGSFRLEYRSYKESGSELLSAIQTQLLPRESENKIDPPTTLQAKAPVLTTESHDMISALAPTPEVNTLMKDELNNTPIVADPMNTSETQAVPLTEEILSSLAPPTSVVTQQVEELNQTISPNENLDILDN